MKRLPKGVVKEVVSEKDIFREGAPAWCRNPNLLENAEVFYERECKVNEKGEKTACQVKATLVTIGKGTAYEKTYRFEKPLSLSEALTYFKQKCDCACSREYKIAF